MVYLVGKKPREGEQVVRTLTRGTMLKRGKSKKSKGFSFELNNGVSFVAKMDLADVHNPLIPDLKQLDSSQSITTPSTRLRREESDMRMNRADHVDCLSLSANDMTEEVVVNKYAT